jgi:hypothetical protein
MFKPFTNSINCGALTLGQGMRGIFLLSSHVQASNLGLIVPVGLDRDKIALTMVLTA